ncbi:MAG: PPE family protein [Actinomycetota bacterium]|nr:PPE family protein [Actinomycetota bacterium]
MTMPIWAAFPPEVHSAALSSGPGPGSLLAAEQAWQALSAEYDTAAAELSDLLAEVQAGTWQGPTAEKFVAAHVPYLAWLLQNSADSSAAALEADTVAAAYTAALSAMPTLEELEANHAAFAQLVATNFLGVNTIPIALNEMDYLRMWLQAATTMAIYEAVSETAQTWVPPTAPPPPIQLANPPNQDAGGGADQLSWWVTRVQEVAQELDGDLSQSGSNPSTVLNTLMGDPLLAAKVPHWAGEALYTFLPQVPNLMQLSFGLIAPSIPVAGAAGLTGLAGLAGVPQPAPTLPGAVAAPAPAPSHTGAPAAMAPGLGAPASTPPTAPMHAPTPATASASAAAPAPPAPGVPAVSYPYVVGPPGLGAGTNMSVGTRAGQKSPEPDAVAAPAVAAAREARRRRRTRPGLIDPGHRYEYLDDGSGAQFADRSATASDRGAGRMGFAGTVSEAGATPVGLTTLAGASLDDNPRLPLLPSSWSPDTDEGTAGS